jgi:hypothetical protein
MVDPAITAYRDRAAAAYDDEPDRGPRDPAARAAVLAGDAAGPPVRPRTVDVVLARHLAWTLPDPPAALAPGLAVAPGRSPGVRRGPLGRGWKVLCGHRSAVVLRCRDA